MTIERRIVVGLEDIKRISFQCEKCAFRITMSPQEIVEIPMGCPNHSWLHGNLRQMNANSVMYFLSGLNALRSVTSEVSMGFKILIEFDEPTD